MEVGQWAAMAVALLAGLIGWGYWRWAAALRNLQCQETTPPVPPGCFGWPVVGETLNFLAANRSNNSIQFINTRVAKYGEVFTTHLFGEPTVSLGAPDGNKFLFSNENKLVQNSWPSTVQKLLGKHSVPVQVGEAHRVLRRSFIKFFNPEGLESFVPRIDAIARDHITKYWDGKESIQGVPTVKEFTFAVAADLFVSLADHDARFRPLEAAVEDLLAGLFQLPIDLPGTAYHKGCLARQSMLRIIQTLIVERKQELAEGTAASKKDLLAYLLTAPSEDGVAMADEVIQDNIITMLFAGHDTSSITLAMVLKYLHLNPDCLSKLIQEQLEIAKEKKPGAPLDWDDTRRMKYTWQVVQETLRLQPPAIAGFRAALQDFQYAGYSILKGWKLFWSVNRSHRNPAYFPDPEKFDPSRFAGSGPPPFTWIPFGGGPRACLGNEFARTEILVFLHHIALRFQWAMVDPQEPISIDPMPIFKRRLQLSICKRRPELKQDN